MIRLLDYGAEVGINIGNTLKWYLKTDLSVSSNEDANISIFDKGVEIVSENTSKFLIPNESSIKDLIFLIKEIITSTENTITKEEKVISSDYTLTNKDQKFLLITDVSTSSITITLPEDPIPGMSWKIKDNGSADLSVNYVIIESNEKEIEGNIVSPNITTNYGYRTFFYSETQNQYLIL
jgi:predicted secreted protein